MEEKSKGEHSVAKKSSRWDEIPKEKKKRSSKWDAAEVAPRRWDQEIDIRPRTPSSSLPTSSSLPQLRPEDIVYFEKLHEKQDKVEARPHRGKHEESNVLSIHSISSTPLLPSYLPSAPIQQHKLYLTSHRPRL